jgi:hypothetical protein
MIKQILSLSILLLNIGCSHPRINDTNRKPKHRGYPVAAIKNNSLKQAAKAATKDIDCSEYPDWAEIIVAPYVRQTNNEWVRKAVMEKLKEEWVYDQLEKTDTATYRVFQIGHDVADGGGTNVRFISDSRVYSDSLKRKLYEYDSVNGKPIEWQK